MRLFVIIAVAALWAASAHAQPVCPFTPSAGTSNTLCASTDFVSRGVGATTFAKRPASPVEGMIRGFTDSNVNTWGSSIAGGGTNHVLGYYDGTNWTVVGQ